MVAGPGIRGILAGLVAVVAVSLVGLGVFAWDRLADPGTHSIPVAQAPTVPAGGAAAANCPRAQPNLFAALSAHLAQRDDAFGSAQFAFDENRLTYLSAPVGHDGRLRAAAPVWVYGGSGYAWLNDAARRLSSGLPDGRALYGADPSGAAATRIASCATSGGR